MRRCVRSRPTAAALAAATAVLAWSGALSAGATGHASPLARAASAAHPAAATAAGPRPLLVRAGAAGVFKPRRYCPANHTCFANARWTAWGRRAVAWADATTSYPGSGEALRDRIRFTFDRPRTVCGGLRYTRARWRHPGRPRTAATLLAPACTWTGA